MNKRLFYNEDSDNFGHHCYDAGIMPDEKLINGFIDYYKDSGITDFVMALNCAVCSTESEIFESYMDKFLKTEDFGEPADYKNTYMSVYYHIYRELGLDLYGLWIKRIWENGMNPWISFRMNDCHHPYTCRSESNLPQWRTSAHRKQTNYYDITLDYTKPQVRDKIVAFIKEQLSKYDVYGIELDFNREPYCFPAGKKDEGRKIITDLFKEIKSFVSEIGEQRGRDIKISVLCQADPADAYYNGFDVAEIARLGLVDMVVACPRWNTMNNDIPVAIWKKLLPEKVSFACKQEFLLRSYPTYREGRMPTVSCEHSLGQAAAFDAMGTDATYLYNYFYKYFNEHDSLIENPDSVIKLNEGSSMWPKNYYDTIKRLSDTDGYKTCDLRFPLTYNDFHNLYSIPNARLPQMLNDSETQIMRIVTSKIEAGRKCYLIVETAEEIDPKILTVYANRKAAKYTPIGKEDKYIFTEKVYTFELDCDIDGCVEVEMLSDSPCRVEFMEIFAEGRKL